MRVRQILPAIAARFLHLRSTFFWFGQYSHLIPLKTKYNITFHIIAPLYYTINKCDMSDLPEESSHPGDRKRSTMMKAGDRRQQPQNNSAGGDQKRERPKKESIIDLSKFVDKQVRVKFQGGREASGKLKGYDNLLNLVLDDTIEYLRDADDFKITNATRNLGLVVCRGPAVTVVCPQEGHDMIQNPFI